MELPENCVGRRGKDKSVGRPLKIFQILSSWIESVITLSSGETLKKFDIIFKELICIYFDQRRNPLQNFSCNIKVVYLYTLIAVREYLAKVSVAIFISLIASHFEHAFILLPNLSGDCIDMNSNMEGFPSRHILCYNRPVVTRDDAPYIFN